MKAGAFALIASGAKATSILILAFASALVVVPMHVQAAGDEEKCGLWLGPSSIKESEEHGWGHSMFTGKFIPKGTALLGSGVMDTQKGEKVFGDLFVPVYDWEALDMAAWARGNLDDDDLSEEGKKEKDKQSEEENGEQNLPPIFNEMWNGDIYDAQVLQSYEGMRVFMPGLPVICPCSSEGFNLEQIQTVYYRDWRDVRGHSHDETPPSWQAGSFSYLSNSMFVAARDIQPGEELVVECADNSDEFNPSDYPLSKFTPKEAGGYSICLDDKLEERLADHTPNVAGGGHGGQRGLFAKKKLASGEVLTSSPMIPVHREEMTMDREKYNKLYEDQAELHGNYAKSGLPPKKEQLLLNYMYGHPESNLLWLPTAPLIHSVNHANHDDKNVTPNAKIRWHSDKYTEAQAAGKPLTRRQEFHHKELLEMDSLEVVKKHGMGLMVDLVATRDINDGEEILIDYGKAWDDALKQHKIDWDSAVESIKQEHAQDKAKRKQTRKQMRQLENLKIRSTHGKHLHRHKDVENAMTAIPLSSYVTAADYNELHSHDEIRTVTEQHRNPYPSNLETACYFEGDWLDDHINEDEEAEAITYESWYDQMHHTEILEGCLLPCIITERRQYVPDEENQKKTFLDDDDDDDDGLIREKKKRDLGENGGSAFPTRYTAKLLDTHEENTSINFDCHIYKRFEYIYLDIPREGITFVDKPHSTDHWIEQAFRQPIGLPEEMVPQIWRDKTRSKKRGMRGSKVVPKPQPELSEEEKADEEEYQSSLMRWIDVDSRREKLEETADKRILQSPRNDL